MEFFAIAKRLGGLLDADPEQFEPDPELAAKPATPIGFNNEAKEVARVARLSAEGRAESAAVLFAAERLEKMRAIPIDREAYTIISDRRDARELDRARSARRAMSRSMPRAPGSTTRPPTSSGLSLRAGAGQGRLSAAQPHQRQRHVRQQGRRAARRARGAGAAEAAAGRPFHPQDRAQRQIRPRPAAALRHHADAVRRHAADELRARWRAVQHAEPAQRALAQPHRHRDQGADRHRARTRRPSPKSISPPPRATPPRTPT